MAIIECDGIVIGSPYSPNGTNQYVSCKYPAKFKAIWTDKSGKIHEMHYCGVHIRSQRKMQEYLEKINISNIAE
jgi:hypothetical protein